MGKGNSMDFAGSLALLLELSKWAKVLRIVPKTVPSHWDMLRALNTNHSFLVFGSSFCKGLYKK